MVNYSAHGLIGMSVSMIVISVVSSCLRVWSRLVTPGVHLCLDDWLALAALVPVLTICALGIYLPRHGIGSHVWEIPLEELTIDLKIFFAADFILTIALTLAKLSVLAFYVRIFGLRNNTTFRWKISFYFVLFVTICWPITDFIFGFLQCSPTRKYWSPHIPGNCDKQVANYLQSAFVNVGNDVMILVLPLPKLFKLQMKRGKKALMVAIFVCGYSVPLMSIGRLIILSQVGSSLQLDFSYAVTAVGYWLVAEPGISIFAISLPATFHLCKRGYDFGAQSLIHRRDFPEYRYRGKFSRTGDTASGFRRLDRLEESNDLQFAPYRGHAGAFGEGAFAGASHVTAGHEDDPNEISSYPLEVITVRKDIRVEYGALEHDR